MHKPFIHNSRLVTRCLIAWVLLASLTACVTAGEVKPVSDTEGFIQTSKIEIYPKTPEDDPKTFLRLHHFQAEQDILLELRLNLDKIKSVELFDLNAEDDLCDIHHSISVAYQYYQIPIKASSILVAIGTPCIHKRAARFKLVVKTEKEKYYRVQTLQIHPLARTK